MDVAARFTVGFVLPALSYQLIREGNRPWHLNGDEDVIFFMRPAQSSDLKIDGKPGAIADAASDTIRYEWDSVDVDTEGDFRGWFRIIPVAGEPEETDEFDIFGLAHSPGRGVRTGPITRAARREMPVAWDFLANLPHYGDIELQETVETVKLAVLNAPLTLVEEEALDRRVIDFIGKRVAVEVIGAAIDFWSNQIVSQTARGSDEVESYPDRIAALEKKRAYLIGVTNRLELTVGELIGRPIRRPSATPAVDTLGPMVSPGLENFPRPFGGQSPDPRKASPVSH